MGFLAGVQVHAYESCISIWYGKGGISLRDGVLKALTFLLLLFCHLHG
jgi:hypothetical protein